MNYKKHTIKPEYHSSEKDWSAQIFDPKNKRIGAFELGCTKTEKEIINKAKEYINRRQTHEPKNFWQRRRALKS